MDFYDISREFFSAPRYHGVSQPHLHAEKRLCKGAPCNVSTLTANLHTATHCDAFSHFLDGGSDSAEMPLQHYFGPCLVLNVPVRTCLDETTLRAILPQKTCRLLLRGTGERGLTLSGSRFLISMGVFTIGTEAAGIASPQDARAVHRLLFEAGVAVIEGLELSRVSPGPYQMAAFPIKISGAEAAPCRAILWK